MWIVRHLPTILAMIYGSGAIGFASWAIADHDTWPLAPAYAALFGATAVFIIWISSCVV